ncbi:hypothetical protein AB1N83_013631 [Pleurotus pulmonarius]
MFFWHAMPKATLSVKSSIVTVVRKGYGPTYLVLKARRRAILVPYLKLLKSGLVPYNWVVLVTGMSYYVTATPPNRRVNQSELLINTWVERFFLPRLMFLKLFVGSACFMHVFSSVFSLGTSAWHWCRRTYAYGVTQR